MSKLLKGGLYRDYIGVYIRGYIGIMENEMETTIYSGYIGDYIREYYRGY